MRFHRYLLLVLSLYVFEVCGQGRDIDSLIENNDLESAKKQLLADLNNAVDLKDQSKTIQKLSSILFALYQYDSSLILDRKFLELSNQVNSDFGDLIESYSRIGYAYFALGKTDSSVRFFRKGLSIVKKQDRNKEEEFVASLYGNYGILLARTNQLDSALFYFKKQLVITTKLPPAQATMGAYNSVALCLDLMNRPDEAINYYLAGLEFSDKNQLDGSRVFSNLGRLFLLQKNYDKAIAYSKKSLNKIPEKDSKGAYTVLGTAYLNKENFERAKFYYLKDYYEAKTLGRTQAIITSTTNLAVAYNELGKLDSALMYLKEALGIARKSKLRRNETQILTELGTTYFLKLDLEKAKIHSLNAYAICDTISGFNDIKLKVVKNLSKIYESDGLFKEALRYANELQEMYQVFNDNRHRDQVAEIEINYETEKKENEILALKAENSAKEARIATSRFWNLAGGTVVFVIVTAFGFIHTWQKQRHQLEVSRKKSVAEEQIKQKIGMEIHTSVGSQLRLLAEAIKKYDPDLYDKALKISSNLQTLAHELSVAYVPGNSVYNELVSFLLDNTDEKKYKLSVEPFSLKVPKEYMIDLVRITQELITNNLKYSEAKSTKITVRHINNLIQYTYEDDGIGSKTLKKGHGLTYIEERADNHKGHVVFQTEEKKGFYCKIDMPYTA